MFLPNPCDSIAAFFACLSACGRQGRLGGAPVSVRRFQPEDFEAAYRLDQTCYPPGIAYSRYALREFLSEPGAQAWVAEEEGKLAPQKAGLVGFVIVRRLGADRGHVVTLDVREDRRRRGIGRTLLQTAETWLAAHGVKRVRLETAVDNHAAVAFWQQAAYEILGVLPGYYLGRDDAYRMEKNLF